MYTMPDSILIWSMAYKCGDQHVTLLLAAFKFYKKGK